MHTTFTDITREDISSLDEVFYYCSVCRDKFLYAYWDVGLESYIYLLDEHDDLHCSKCRFYTD